MEIQGAPPVLKKPLVLIILLSCAAAVHAQNLDFWKRLVSPQPTIAADGSSSFPLSQIHVFGSWDRRQDFTRGRLAGIMKKLPDEVKAVPAHVSENPRYGTVQFGPPRDGDIGMTFYFVCDESKGTGQGYDRMHLDLNRDLDLTNDAPLKALEKYPGAYTPPEYYEKQTFFESFTVSFHSPAGIDVPIEIMPSLILYRGNDFPHISFINTTAFRGGIVVNGRKFDAILGHMYSIPGAYDSKGTNLMLIPQGEGASEIHWWGGNQLDATHEFGGQFYRFSASPRGDLLTVRPYTGDTGIFEIGAGGRKLDAMTFNGSLTSSETAVAVGTMDGSGWPMPLSKCIIPVGDYLPSYLSVNYGKLQISVSQNYHADGKPCGRDELKILFCFPIRRDKPCVLDFSNKPEVLFALPAKDTKIKRGGKLDVKGVLIDPGMDIMIRGLEDTSRKENREGFERNISLDPKVVITRADGEIVAEGVMPFG